MGLSPPGPLFASAVELWHTLSISEKMTASIADILAPPALNNIVVCWGAADKVMSLTSVSVFGPDK